MGVISSSAKAVRKPHEGAIDVEITILTVKLRLEIGGRGKGHGFRLFSAGGFKPSFGCCRSVMY